MSTHLLLVEDDHDLRDALESTLRRAKWDVTAVDSAEAGLAALQLRSADLVVSDIRLPGMDGLALLQRLREQSGHTPVVLMTAHADAMLAIAALKAGARDLLLKPFGAEQLVDVVRRHAPQVRSETAASGLLANDPLMRTLVARAERAARVDASVLLTGESGVGKEVMARHIHLASARARAPFVAINCAAIPDSLLEATLFGHEKGSFTGASRQQAGKFEQAQGGTLFLDEIGELPTETQVKLLRVLQERSLERLGGQSSIAVDIRIIAATNRDLARDVASGRFREDLLLPPRGVPGAAAAAARPPRRHRAAGAQLRSALWAQLRHGRRAALTGRRGRTASPPLAGQCARARKHHPARLAADRLRPDRGMPPRTACSLRSDRGIGTRAHVGDGATGAAERCRTAKTAQCSRCRA